MWRAWGEGKVLRRAETITRSSDFVQNAGMFEDLRP